MSEEKVDTVEDLLVDIIKQTDKILEETEPQKEIEVEKLRKLMCERTQSIIQPESVIKGRKTSVIIEPKLEVVREPATISEDKNFGLGESEIPVQPAEFILPDYSPSFNTRNALWEVSQPIILTGNRWPAFDLDIEGIHLNRGIYKIQYTLVNTSAGHGLGLFTQNKKFIRLLGYISIHGSVAPIPWATNEVYLELKNNHIIALTNHDTEFRPYSFPGLINITVHKLKTTPN